ncbi:MAG: haloacid dehalogenase [Cyanobacteria bacterium P01_D01_bin.1]
MARRILLMAVGEEWLGLLAETMAEIKSVLNRLQSDGVSVILFSGCNRAQLEPIRRVLEIDDPFIVESGSAIFTPVEHNPFAGTVEKALGDRDGSYFVMQLGCPYVQARAGLRVIANMISHPLKGLGDFTIPQLQRLASLSETAAHQAKAREFSELFMTPKAVEPEVLQQAAEEMGFDVIWRATEESRFSELVGAGASLTAAVAALLSAYSSLGEELEVIGLSQHQLALDCLRAATRSVEAEITFQEVPLTSASTDCWLTAIESL